MARYEHLPIFKKAMEFSVYLEETIKNFSRYHKYAIGAELRGHSRRILRLIIDANSARERQPILHELARQCDMLSTMLVLAKDVGWGEERTPTYANAAGGCGLRIFSAISNMPTPTIFFGHCGRASPGSIPCFCAMATISTTAIITPACSGPFAARLGLCASGWPEFLLCSEWEDIMSFLARMPGKFPRCAA